MAGLFTAIGKNILKRLDQLQVSQTELAERIGVSKQVINKIVQGKKAINAVEISSIAEALNLSIDELVQTETDLGAEDSFLLMMGSILNSFNLLILEIVMLNLVLKLQ